MSFCKNCGKQTVAGAPFCPYCGTKIQEGSGYCPNCGKKTVEGAPFCPYCGTRVAAAGSPSPRVCAVCGSPLAEGQLFCDSCGTACIARGEEAPPPVPPEPAETGRKLEISRRAQAFGSNMAFEVYVDQNGAGALYPGGTILVSDFSDPVRVDICCMNSGTASWGAMLTVPPDPKISIEVHLEGRLNSDCRLVAEVSGGAVIQRQAYYVAGDGWPDW